MTRVVVTGGTGFLGSWMVRGLAEDDHEVTATHIDPPGTRAGARTPGVEYRKMDVTDARAVARVLDDARPEEIYHFAGQAFVIPSWERPQETFRINLEGTLHILEWMRRRSPRTRLMFAGSGTEYGEPDRVPTPEDSALRPTSPYASSKAAADLLCYQYTKSFELPTFRCRIFGTTGPGKTGDSCNDFASQIAGIEANGAPGTVRVGNLDKRRDIQDVRDAVRAMRHVVERGTPGEAYNIGRGETQLVREILETLVSMSRVQVTIEQEAKRIRLVDEPVHLADVSRLKGLGWSPTIPFRDTLRDILEHWRRSAESPPPLSHRGSRPSKAGRRRS